MKTGICIFVVFGFSMAICKAFDIIEREGWHAEPPTMVEAMPNPVPYVIIHHSYIPPACNTTEECISAMRWMQDFHMLTNGWNDIGYSFAVGGDANAYVGRGWSHVGAHAPNFNDRSIGICVIGDWQEELPPAEQLDAVHKLIEVGVQLGKIDPEYVLYGHRQVKDTECPGNSLYEEINKWEHFSPTSEDKKTT